MNTDPKHCCQVEDNLDLGFDSLCEYLFREVSTHFQANLAGIEKNLESLNQRMEALKQKK